MERKYSVTPEKGVPRRTKIQLNLTLKDLSSSVWKDLVRLAYASISTEVGEAFFIAPVNLASVEAVLHGAMFVRET